MQAMERIMQTFHTKSSGTFCPYHLIFWKWYVMLCTR
jgi:DNA-binding XRE family transcriptional regulator